MRILALTNLFPTPIQPHRAPFNRQQLRALASRHELAVIAPIAWTDELAQRCRGGRSALPASRRVAVDGITVDHPRYVFPPRVLRGWYGHCFRRSVRRTFARAVSEFRPDAVLATWAYPDGWAAVELAREARLPVVVKVHGSDVLLPRPNSARGRLTEEALKRADAVVAVSRHLQGEVVGMGVGAERVHVVYGGVDTTLFCPGPRDEARRRLGLEARGPLILFVGNLVGVKGLDVLLGACGRLHRGGEGFECRIIGQGPLRAALERRIGTMGLQDRVKLLGALPAARLPDWYRAADLFVLPSRSEGVPNVLLESTACGTPFVATRVGGIPEIAGADHPGLVPPEDPEALASAIGRALSAAGAGAWAMGSGLRPQSWEESAAALSDVLQGLNQRRVQ
jgi:glycosyltransferase involved in cell wall biosynthesis